MQRIFLPSMNLWGIFDPDYNTWHPEVKIRYLRRQRKMLFILIAVISISVSYTHLTLPTKRIV